MIKIALCRHCGKSFEYRHTCEWTQPPHRCADCKRAQSLAYNAKHRSRERCLWYGVPYDPQVNPEAVFERDGYVCQMCGCATLRRYTLDSLGRAEINSPTVDHIEPLYWRGKGHTWDNVRLLCFYCNCVERQRQGHAETVESRKVCRTSAR